MSKLTIVNQENRAINPNELYHNMSKLKQGAFL